MQSYKDAMDKVYEEKEKIVIVGLTGRTGAGCSTAAKILKKDFRFLDLQYECMDSVEKLKNEEYKFDIIKEYISQENRWIPFNVIGGSCAILSFVFEYVGRKKHTSDALINYLDELQSSNSEIKFKIDNYNELKKELKGLDYIFKKIQEKPLPKKKWVEFDKDEIKAYYDMYVISLPDYKERVKKILLKYSCYEERKKKIQDYPPVKFHLYTYLLQKMGNNIRSSGNPYNDEFHQEKMLVFAKRIEKIIELIIRYNKLFNINSGKTRICIDAIRNSNESNYLKDKYRSYYLFAISVEESDRRNRLEKLNLEEKKSLDEVEYNTKMKNGAIFYHQNIANCFEMADVHLHNEEIKGNHYFFLTWQLVKYISLIIHPGLVTPNAIERCMQLAYNAKYNSGCLSRQVGAVVTGNDFSVKAVGWNEVPEGQLSCSLRTIQDYCIGNREECFSCFEYEDTEFNQVMNKLNEIISEKKLWGRKFPYCFKDVYNGYQGERNQVYTRSLHAEENAFLQISKYGGKGIQDGFLFCTASPCELCSKKAYQLGIKNIFYIDPYPGIAQKHILSFGKNNNNPKVNLFHGVIGEAYVRMYKPIFPYKDELELVSGVDLKEETQNALKEIDNNPDTNDFVYHSIELCLEFKDRENIQSTRTVDIEVKNGEYGVLNRQLTWTGSSYDKSELVGNTEGMVLVDTKDRVSPFKYQIKFDKKKQHGDHIKYSIQSMVKDESHLMHEYFAQMIRNPTEHLVIKVIIPSGAPLIEEVKYKRYADFNMECEYFDKFNVIKELESEDENKKIFMLEIDSPNLFYTYSIEWDFVKVKT